MEQTCSFVATGDYLQTRRIPTYNEKNFEQIANIINSADVRITNLEITVSEEDVVPGAISGGTFLKTTPDRIEDMKAFGFNLVGTANNHSLDYGYEGLFSTKKHLSLNNLLHTGTGKNLYEASKPVYLDTLTGRVAFIAVTSTAHLCHLASEQRFDIQGRPGVNGLRHIKKHIVSKEEFDHLKQIADKTEVNAFINMMVKEGFIQPFQEGILPFGKDLYGFDLVFEIGSEQGLTTMPHELDMKRIECIIDESRRQADYVVINFHAHEMKGEDKEIPADFIKTAARRFIDAGAHSVVGHGPHVLRGIEIYKNRPIFYSLGNFIFQSEIVEVLPQDFYDSNNIPKEHYAMQALDLQTKNGKNSLITIREVMESVIPFWTMEGGEVKEIILYPIELGHGRKRSQNGFPSPAVNSHRILNRLKNLSEPFGTVIKVEDEKGIGRIILNEYSRKKERVI